MNRPPTATWQSAQPLWFLHNLAVIHTRSDQTNGSYALVELTGAPGDTPPLHVHHHDDQGFYVLDGALRLHAERRPVVRLQAGEFAVTPRGVPHMYVVESEKPARCLRSQTVVSTGSSQSSACQHAGTRSPPSHTYHRPESSPPSPGGTASRSSVLPGPSRSSPDLPTNARRAAFPLLARAAPCWRRSGANKGPLARRTRNWTVGNGARAMLLAFAAREKLKPNWVGSCGSRPVCERQS
jgi:quercetin dioxygenase-like cupin family protein